MERGEDDKRDVEQSAEEHVVESVVETREANYVKKHKKGHPQCREVIWNGLVIFKEKRPPSDKMPPQRGAYSIEIRDSSFGQRSVTCPTYSGHYVNSDIYQNHTDSPS